MLDLKKLSSYYQAHNSGTQLNGKPALFLRPTKDAPMSYFVPLLDEPSDMIGIPLHNFVPLADNGHRSFVCRRFLEAIDPKIDCPLCDDGLKAYRKYYFTAIQFEGENVRKLAPALDTDGLYKIGILDLSKALTTSIETARSMSGSYMAQVYAYARIVDQSGKTSYEIQKAKDLECKEVDGKILPDLDYQKLADSVSKYADLNDYVMEETKPEVYKLYIDSREAEK